LALWFWDRLWGRAEGPGRRALPPLLSPASLPAAPTSPT
jgi:hypothetical protein